MTHPRRLRIAALVAILTLQGCTAWRSGPTINQPLGPRAQVRIWVHGVAHQVHGVRLFGDSVAAVPFTRSPDCVSCAIRLARADIDSVQVRSSDPNMTLLLAVSLSPLMYLLYLAFAMSST